MGLSTGSITPFGRVPALHSHAKRWELYDTVMRGDEHRHQYRDSDLSHGEVLFVDRYQVHMLHGSNSEKIIELVRDDDKVSFGSFSRLWVSYVQRRFPEWFFGRMIPHI